MNKIEFLAASLPYGLKFFYEGSDGYFKGDTLKDDYNQLETLFNINNLGYCEDERGNEIDEQFKPIIRHLDTLNRECIQADYNGGKPFIPIEEICKIRGITKKNTSFLSDFKLSINNETLRFDLMVLLIKWHFWPNMPEGEEVVYVTDEFNPYV